MWRCMTRWRHQWAWPAILFGALLSPAAAAAQTPLSLRDAIARGLAHNEQYQIALAGVERAQGQIVTARAGVFPTIGMSGSYSRALKRPEIVISGLDSAGNSMEQRFQVGSKHTTIGGIAAQQTLFEGGGVLAAWKAAQSYRAMQLNLVAMARHTLESDVAESFFGTLLAQALADVASQTVRQAEAHYEVVDQKYKAGLVSEYDHLRAHVSVANARPQLIQADNDLRLAMMQLKNLIGLDADSSVALAESEPDSSAWESWELDALVQQAEGARPDLAATQDEIRSWTQGINVYKAQRWPQLTLDGSFGWQWATDERYGLRDKDMSRSWTVGLNLSYSLFDGFRRHGMIQTAQVDLKEAQLRRAELLRSVALQVESARSRFQEASERLEAQREAVAEAERGLAIANRRYESGVGTQLEVLDAQVALSTAQVFAETARHDRRVARVQWRRAMGESIVVLP